ncbi:MAG: hypothetical protein WBC22_09265 [Sedimentisphaerales bacterium]
MKLNRKCMMMVMGAALVGLLLSGSGCKESDEESSVGTARAADSVALCVKCGQIKGSDLCCKPDQATCAGCGLVKDSPGCCNIPKGATEAAICAKCGQIKGSELCCKPNQTICAMCGLVKDSPGCCKIPKK